VGKSEVSTYPHGLPQCVLFAILFDRTFITVSLRITYWSCPYRAGQAASNGWHEHHCSYRIVGGKRPVTPPHSIEVDGRDPILRQSKFYGPDENTFVPFIVGFKACCSGSAD